MERNDNELFDQLVREKLTGYIEPPEPEWIKNIHVKKSRVINLYHLYRLMLITVLVGAGIFASVQFTPYNTEWQSNNVGSSQNTASSQRESDELTKRNAYVKSDWSDFRATVIPTTATPLQSNQSVTNVQNTLHKSTNKTSPSKPNAYQPVNGNVVPKNGNKPLRQEIPEQPNRLQETGPAHPKEETPTDKQESEKETANKCEANFDFYTSYTGEINFTNTSNVGSKTRFAWSFGDGTSATENEPVHMYQTSGKYEVTLVVTDVKTGCQAKATKIIAYKNQDDRNTPIHISGELYAGSTPVKNGTVELYQFDVKKGGFVLVTSIRTSQSGAYSTQIKRNERYLLKGLPAADLSDYKATFWGNSETIESASEIIVMPSEKDNLLGYTIELALAEKQKITENAKDEPIANGQEQRVLLLDQNNNIVGVGKVDANGDFSFGGGIPPGEYKVLNPETGATTAKVVTSNEPVSGSIFNKNDEIAHGSDEKVSVFPNPAGNTVNFGINSNGEETATIILTDAAGVELSRKQVVFTSGFNQTQYDLTNYSPGIYYVLVFKGNQQVLSNRLVKMIDTGK